ncbi:MAG: hypothetical protein K2W82_09825 [Candidatus Obscuribacterales bacterium]|nr:hypothetical protein [Candidatus Obscuribacterales bacterium]
MKIMDELTEYAKTQDIPEPSCYSALCYLVLRAFNVDPLSSRAKEFIEKARRAIYSNKEIEPPVGERLPPSASGYLYDTESAIAVHKAEIREFVISVVEKTAKDASRRSDSGVDASSDDSGSEDPIADASDNASDVDASSNTDASDIDNTARNACLRALKSYRDYAAEKENGPKSEVQALFGDKIHKQQAGNYRRQQEVQARIKRQFEQLPKTETYSMRQLEKIMRADSRTIKKALRDRGIKGY